MNRLTQYQRTLIDKEIARINRLDPQKDAAAAKFLPVLQNAMLQRFIILFDETFICESGEASPMNESLPLFKQIWLYNDVDERIASASAAIPMPLIANVILQAKVNLWIFPDGRVSTLVFNAAKQRLAKDSASKESQSSRKSNSEIVELRKEMQALRTLVEAHMKGQ